VIDTEVVTLNRAIDLSDELFQAMLAEFECLVDESIPAIAKCRKSAN